MAKIEIINIEVDNYSFEEALQKILILSDTGKKNMVFTPNIDHLAELNINKEFLKAYMNAAIIIPDGMPLLWIAKLKGTPLKERISGADIFKSILDRTCAMNKKILIMGGDSIIKAEIIKNRIQEIYEGIKLSVLFPDFGFEKDEFLTKYLIDAINQFCPDILFVCTGAPKSEIWLSDNREKILFKVALCVGAAPEFLVGIKSRAPYFIQKIGLEWFYRLLREPIRLFKRYVIKDLPFFIKVIFKQLFSKY